jgi:hypothetical protein
MHAFLFGQGRDRRATLDGSAPPVKVSRRKLSQDRLGVPDDAPRRRYLNFGLANFDPSP